MTDNITLMSAEQPAATSSAFSHSAYVVTSDDFTTNVFTTQEPPQPVQRWKMAIICLVCSLIIVGTILGNVLVCTAVAIVRKLRTPSNLLIVSLAVSDLLVAILVMPFAVMLEVYAGYWILGGRICDMWTCLDVLLCTASILNLCAISIDRYLVITMPFQYAMKRTPRWMAMMIAAVWIVSALISITPIFGWKEPYEEGRCIVSQNKGYQFYATFVAFYLPLVVMVFIYIRIYMVSSRIAQAEAKSKPIGDSHHSGGFLSGTSTPLRKDSHVSTNERIVDEENHNFPNGAVRKQRDDSTQSMLPKKQQKRFQFLKKSRLNRISSSKERKATKTLGVIMGAFIACWLPFFIIALVRPFRADLIPDWLSSLFLWLGFANSFLNPIIYARFNRDFRTPFKEILSLRCRGINRRLRSESYVEQYGGRAATMTGGTGTLRDCIKPPVDTVVRYHSQGQTIVKLGNGNSSTAAADTAAAKL